MNTTISNITYGTSRTTTDFPKGLFAPTVPVQPAQPRNPATNKLLTTFPIAIGTTLTAMFVGLSPTSHIAPPTYVQTTQYIAPARIVHTKEKGALRGYQINSSQNAAISEYLHHHPSSSNFLGEVATIIDSIYGLGVIRVIHIVDDIDTDKSIMELAIQSGLPLNDEFIKKDQLLFQRIEESGLAWGFRDVVISQG